MSFFFIFGNKVGFINMQSPCLTICSMHPFDTSVVIVHAIASIAETIFRFSDSEIQRLYNL